MARWFVPPAQQLPIGLQLLGTKPTQAGFAIFYSQGTQHYDLEPTLQPDEQMWIDVGQLIREQIPYKNSNILPADLSSDSYELRDLTDQAIGTLFEGGVTYDKTYGHVAGRYQRFIHRAVPKYCCASDYKP